MTHQVVLRDVARVLNGLTPANTSTEREGPLFFGQVEVSAGGSGEPRYVRAGVDLSRGVPLREGDVVVSLLGQVGRSSVVPRVYEGAVLGRECAAIRLQDTAHLLNGWLLAWTRTHGFLRQVERHASGSTMPRLRRGDLESFSLPVADITAQRRVEQLTTAFDDAVRTASQHLASVQKLRDVEIDLAFRLAAEEFTA